MFSSDARQLYMEEAKLKKQSEPISRRAVSGAIPPVGRGLPPASKEIPLVSGVIPLVSKIPPVTLASLLGRRPRWQPIPRTRRREMTPSEKGLLGFLAIVVTAPVSIPIKMVSTVAKQVTKQADDELQQEAMLRAIRPRPEDEAEMALVTADRE